MPTEWFVQLLQAHAGAAAAARRVEELKAACHEALDIYERWQRCVATATANWQEAATLRLTADPDAEAEVRAEMAAALQASRQTLAAHLQARGERGVADEVRKHLDPKDN